MKQSNNVWIAATTMWSRNDVYFYNSSLRGATLVATKQSMRISIDTSRLYGLLRRLTPSRNDVFMLFNTYRIKIVGLCTVGGVVIYF